MPDYNPLLKDTDQEVEEAIRQVVEEQIIRAIAQYLNEVADTMQANNIQCLNEPTVRAMATEILGRVPPPTNLEGENSVHKLIL